MDRQEFMDFIYSEFESDSDNVRANRIIEAADAYAEGARLAEAGTNCLKPCRCGGHPQAVVDDETETKFGVKCFDCGASIFPEKETLEEAVEAWNRIMGTSRLEDVIVNITYILSVIEAYRDIQNSGGCNECGKRMTCEYAPKLGQLVRYNCPFYEREVKAKEWE